MIEAAEGSGIDIAVRLRASDPAAVTALSTLKDLMPRHCPARLERYDLWSFGMREGVDQSGMAAKTALQRIEELLRHYTDIVNPNKQTWIALEPITDVLPGEDPDLEWVSVVVRNRDDSMSRNWSRILSAVPAFGVRSVSCGTLWRLGYPGEWSSPDARESALAVSVTESRARGLLANPVSQSVSVPCKAGH